MALTGVEIEKVADNGGTVIYLAVNGEYAGHILISDVIKETAPAAIVAGALRGC